METIACDFCGSDKSEVVARQTDKLHCTTNELFTIVRCMVCGLHYTNPRPSTDEIGQYYAESYAFHSAPSGLRQLARTAATKIANWPFAALLDLVPSLGRRLVPSVKPSIPDPVRTYYAAGGKGALLDIGCGAGASAHFWGRSGALLAYRQFADVAGVEISDHARETLATLGIEAWGDIDAVTKDRRFGMIRMNWSLEHVHSPARYFAFLRDRLIPGGRAVIAVLNYDGLIYRLARDCVELPIHLYHFRQLDLENYANRYGLLIDNMCTFSYPQMFSEAARVGLLPEVFASKFGLQSARAFQSTLTRFDRANWGNDMIAVLVLRE